MNSYYYFHFDKIVSSLDRIFGAMEQLEPYVDQTVVLVPQFIRDNDKKGQVFLCAMLACYPLGLIMHLLPYGNIRHVFSFVTGMTLLQIVWDIHWIHTPIVSLTAFWLLQYCRHDTIQRILPTFVMAYLAAAHFHHQYHVDNVLGLDLYFTASHMILTQKLYMLAYNLHDGYLLSLRQQRENDTDDLDDNDHDTKKEHNNNALKAAHKCSEWAIYECPTFLQFLGYTFCFSTVLIGPAIEFAHYQRVCDGSIHYYNNNNNNNKENNRQRPLKGCGNKMPNNIIPTLAPFLKCFGLLFFNAMFDKVCNYRRLASPFFFHLPTFGQRFFYNWLTNFVQRMKVYFTWYLAEGCNNIWYHGFDGYDKETGDSKGFTVASGADVWQMETCESIRVGSRAWNKKTSQWLLRYVYIRNKSRLAIVYSVSAIWHGFYPGYYMLASIVWFMSQCERLGRTKISPYMSPKKWSLYGVTCIITIHALGSYATTAFFLRSWDNVLENWRAHYFCGHIACLAYYAIVSMLPTPTKAKAEVVPSTATDLLQKDILVDPASSGVNDLIEQEEKKVDVDLHANKRKYS